MPVVTTQDSFAGASGSSIFGRAPNRGTNWVDPAVGPWIDFIIDPTGNAMGIGPDSSRAVALSGIPRSRNYKVTARGIHQTGTSWAGVHARYVDFNNLYYVEVFGDGRWNLGKIVGGVTTILAQGTSPGDIWAALPPAAHTDPFDLTLEVSETTQRVWVNDQYPLVTRNDSVLTAVGRPAMAGNRAVGQLMSIGGYDVVDLTNPVIAAG